MEFSHAERMMMTIADVLKELIEAHEQGKDVNLNKWVSALDDSSRIYKQNWYLA